MYSIIRKSILFFLTLCLVLTSLPYAATAEDGEEAETYSLAFEDQAVWTHKKNAKFKVSYWTASAVYCARPTHSAQQSMDLYVPEAYLREDGTIDETAEVGGYTALTAPIIYWNSHGSYVGMVPFGIAGMSTRSTQKGWVLNMIANGFVVCMVGERGKQTVDADGNVIGRGPIAISDLKAGVRFLRHNSAVIPGSTDRIVSVGTSSGGAMSALLGASGNNDYYTPYLEAIGAVMDERDDVFATMAYCPITDLNHADYAYEWLYAADTTGMDDFQKALSQKLAAEFPVYLNGLGLTDESGNSLTVSEDGAQSGSFYDYLAGRYEDAFERYVREFDTGYQGIATYAADGAVDAESLSWLSWDDEEQKATLVTPEGSGSALEAMVLSGFRARQKATVAFDSLDPIGGDNEVFGVQGSQAGTKESARHYNARIAEMIGELKDAFPEAYEKYYADYLADSSDEEVRAWSTYLNALSFLTGEAQSDVSPNFRINMGVCDADTSTAVSATLALLLMKNGIHTEFNLMWGWGHNDCDTPTGLMDWVNGLCR